jgi:hypothetical protein
VLGGELMWHMHSQMGEANMLFASRQYEEAKELLLEASRPPPTVTPRTADHCGKSICCLEVP